MQARLRTARQRDRHPRVMMARLCLPHRRRRQERPPRKHQPRRGRLPRRGRRRACSSRPWNRRRHQAWMMLDSPQPHFLFFTTRSPRTLEVRRQKGGQLAADGPVHRYWLTTYHSSDNPLPPQKGHGLRTCIAAESDSHDSSLDMSSFQISSVPLKTPDAAKSKLNMSVAPAITPAPIARENVMSMTATPASMMVGARVCLCRGRAAGRRH